MHDTNWSILKRIVESPDFARPSGFDAALLSLVKKAIDAKAKEISTTSDKKIITLEWLHQVCARLKIKATGATRAPYLKDALIEAYKGEKEQIFWNEVERAKKDSNEREKQLEQFYDNLCTSNSEARLVKLRSYFVEDGKVEEKLKEFRSKFGIRAGASKKTKLERRLAKIADELALRSAVNGLR